MPRGRKYVQLEVGGVPLYVGIFVNLPRWRLEGRYEPTLGEDGEPVDDELIPCTLLACADGELVRHTYQEIRRQTVRAIRDRTDMDKEIQRQKMEALKPWDELIRMAKQIDVEIDTENDIVFFQPVLSEASKNASDMESDPLSSGGVAEAATELPRDLP